MNKVLNSKNPIILLLVILLSGASLSNVANATAGVITSFTTTIANGTANPPIRLSSLGLSTNPAMDSFTVNVGTTGLEFGLVEYRDFGGLPEDNEVWLRFNSPGAQAGTITIQAKTSAFTVAPSEASNIVTVTVPAANKTIATTSTIANGAATPSIIITGVDFKSGIAASDLTVGVGTTGLTLGTVSRESSTAITVPFTGTAAAGSITIQAKTSAFTVAPGAASNTLTVTVPAAPSPAPAPAPVIILTIPQVALVLTTSAASVGWGYQVKLTVVGGSGTGALTYSSTGTTFCAVDRDGILTPVGVGTCTITANKAGDGTYASAQSNSITITATNAIQPTVAATSVVSMVVGKPVGGVATVRFTVPSTNAGSRVSVVLGTKNSTGKIIYRTLGSATVTSTGVVTYKTRVKLPVGAVLQLRAPGSLILSRVIR
jgi:hypothetical protein